jgi:hypothetical protein
VTKSGSFAVITPNENQKFEKTLPLADMQMMVGPCTGMETDLYGCMAF